MSQENHQVDITRRAVVYTLPGVDAVSVRVDLEYRVTAEAALAMDIYYPPGVGIGSRIPAVIFVSGYPDPGVQARLGCKQKEMQSYISWARLAAASGLAGITYTNREPDPDGRALLDFIGLSAAGLGIDETSIALWACSGNVPMALSLLMRERPDRFKCAVLCYGFMLDLDGSTFVAQAAAEWGFANPCAAKSIDDLPGGLPLLVARAGRDEFPHLNESLDRFVAAALRRNLPITLVNHAAGPHAFDLMHDSEDSREIIRHILGFMRYHLLR